MSSAYDSNIYTGTMPLPVPGKDQYAGYYKGYQSGHTSYSVSPPESENISSASGSVSYGHSDYSSAASYASSMQGDYDSSISASGVDFNEYMHERFNETFDPIPLDKSVAVQAQTSGRLNDKHRQLQEMQQRAQARMLKAQARFSKGVQEAREVHADLEWSQRKLDSLTAKAAKKYPNEYKKARERYPSLDY